VQLTVLILYSMALVALGLWIGRRVDASGTFFVANRKLGPVLLFSTVLAANIGAGSTVGAAGLGYTNGLSGFWWVGSAGIGTLLLAFWIGPRIWRLAQAHDFYTAGDFLEYRYGKTVRATIAILLWLGTLAILAGQLIALSWILNVVAGTPKVVGCLIGGGVMTIYFAAGGLLTSAWVNLVQLVVLVVGFAVALPWALSAAGGWQAISNAVATQAGASETYFDFWGGSTSWTYLALLVPAFIVSPGLLQKVYGARDERTIRISVGASAVALLAFASVPPTLGMIARVYDPNLANGELALPLVLTTALPVALGSIGLAAVFSAEMSSADAILFMLATSLSKDLYKRFVKPDADDHQVLKVARIAALMGGVLGVLLAIVLPSVISSLSIFYSLLGVSLFVPIVVGLQSRRIGTPEALAAISAGVAVLVGARLSPWQEWTGASGWVASLSPNTWGLIASLAVCAVVVLLRSRGRATR
jgi:SSS family solute:Na+ symporter